jgi:DNA repair protein SbcD/Mre11
MRLLHTSDWHLGRTFHRVSLRRAQEAFLDHLVATVREQHVDAVLVSGDIYDRAIPPLPAVRLFDDTLHRLAALNVPAIMISGNHDSPHRLGVGARLIDRAGIHLRTDPATCGTPVILPDRHGDIAVYGLPYLEPALVRDQFTNHPATAATGHAAVIGAAMDQVRADLATRTAGTRSIVLAHAFVTGGRPSDSERDITVGGAASVPATLFDGIHYAALGHLHGCQTLTERLRYSGSPLSYSFSEAGHHKSMWLIDLDAHGAVHADRIDCPVPRALARIRGHLDTLLTDPALSRHETAWVEATLTDPARPDEPMARLADRFPHTLSLVFDPEQTTESSRTTYAQRLTGRSDHQIAEDFIAHVRAGQPPDDHERGALHAAIDAARAQDTRET